MSQTLASEAKQSLVHEIRPRRERPQGKTHRNEKEKHDHKVRRMVYSQTARIRKTARSAFHINSHPLPMPQSLHQQARFTRRFSKIKKHMKMRRGDSKVRNLRFSSRRRSFGLWLLGLLWLSSLLSLFGCFGCWCNFRLAAIRRSPESQVVTEKLHNECAIAV